MKNPLESIRTGLIAQLTELDRDLAATAAQVTHLKLSRQKIAAALRALGGDDPDGTPIGAAPVRPAPKRPQVARAVAELLADNPEGIASADLEGLVADKLAREQGCSAMGLALRLREVLASSQFTTSSGRVELAERNSQLVSATLRP